MFFYLQADWHLEYLQIIFVTRSVASHIFSSQLISMFWKKNDSSLILKYISRKTKEVFWKLGRKNLNHWQEWKDAGLLFIWSISLWDSGWIWIWGGKDTIQPSTHSVSFFTLLLLTYLYLYRGSACLQAAYSWVLLNLQFFILFFIEA